MMKDKEKIVQAIVPKLDKLVLLLSERLEQATRFGNQNGVKTLLHDDK